MFRTAQWYFDNLRLVSSILPDALILCDGERCKWIFIDRFPLPSNFRQESSKLLLMLPGIASGITCPPENCFLEAGLAGKSGRPIAFPHGNGSDGLHYCKRVDLHFDQWSPEPDVVRGDNFVTVLKNLYDHLKSMKEIQ